MTPDGTVYEGSWRFGLPFGRGVCRYADGAEYSGEWRDGQPHGKGKRTY